MFRPTTYRVLQRIVRGVFRLTFSLRAEGTENLPGSGGCILVSNHPTWLDPPLIAAACPRRVRIVAKARLFRLPVVGYFLRGLGCIPVEDDPATGKPTASLVALRRMVAALKAGEVLLVFPEGGRSDHGRVRDFEPGAVVLAKKARVPILPASLCGAYEAWPMGRLLPRPYPITLRVGSPTIIPARMKDREELGVARGLRRQIIERMRVS